MSDLHILYQELIIDHSNHPRNYKCMNDANYVKEGFNPLCGDRLTLYLRIHENRVLEASFQGSGCAISTASASLMTEALKDKTLEEVQLLFDEFRQLVTGHLHTPTSRLGKLSALQSVCKFPMRVKCATLAWHTTMAAIEQKSGDVTTE